MAKSATRRPLGRNPVIAVRVSPPLHQEIAADAKASERTMSEEMAALLRQALDHRKRFPSSTVAQAMESATLAFLLGGANYARDHGINTPWADNLEARRSAAVEASVALITLFVSTNVEEQILTENQIKNRIWLEIVNRPKRSEEEVSREG
jgi:hypothetical protein